MSSIASTNPCISVLVNCYNSEHFLKQALDSIYAQTYQNFEIILVDNCSTDRTAKIAKSYDHRLKYVITEKNIPLYAARNVGLKHASGDFLSILDSDDYWVCDKLKIQRDLMTELPDVDILYTAYRSHYEADQGPLNLLKKLYLKLINFSDNAQSDGYVKPSSIVKNYNINFQTIMFRKSSIQNFQFDDRLNLMGDLDFIYRLIWVNKTRLYYIDRVTAFSRIHERQLSRKSELRWVIESLQVLHKIESNMSKDEIESFNRFFVKFYYSSYLLKIKKYSQSLLIKASFALISVRYFIHFIKSVLVFLKRTHKE